MQSKKRRRLFVDYRVQGALIARVLLYWALCMLSVPILRAILAGIFLTLNSPLAETTSLWLSEVLASFLFVPLVICDVLLVTNRFVGPMFRLRREMLRLAQGEPVPPIAFRTGDMWHEFADAFNALRSRIEQLTGRLPEPAASPEPPASAEPAALPPVEVEAVCQDTLSPVP